MQGDKDTDSVSFKDNEWINLLSQLRVPAGKSKEEAWSAFELQIGKSQIVAGKRSLNIWKYAVAASITLLFGISILFHFTRETRILCNPASIQTVYLPDGSQVMLNAVSEISFRKNLWKADRKVKLKGEAFFTVKKGSRFEVVTDNGKIQVLGTRFNVYARNNQLNVYCETGKVAVIAGDTAYITSGLKAHTQSGSVVQTIKAQARYEAAWKNGDFWFSNAPLEEVIAELERQFKITIQYHNNEKRYYSGYFSRNSLQRALETVFKPLQLNYIINNKTIQILNLK